jgi:hypothetical protein
VRTETVATPFGAGTATVAAGSTDDCQPRSAAGLLGAGVVIVARVAAGAAGLSGVAVPAVVKGRGSATMSTSLTRSAWATLSRTCCPAVMAVRASDTSSALANGLPLTPRSSSPMTMPAAAAGPDGTSSTIVQRPGAADSATDIPSHPGVAAVALAEVVAGGAPRGGAAVG